MINIKYKRAKHSLTVKGHAYSGVPGHDLICAACSMLTYTYAQAVRSADEHGEALCAISNGNARIALSADNANLTIALDAIAAGFALLGASYPDNVSVEII